ncbi:MAG: heme ABC transporter substrate-binding protein IsdE [Marinisporobacter sp.]|jgi:iron complex transport system substrate-binding protein|nr:heme ABC transporter substrate-binding protein IsdE [Marinisporobacter sp.]
MKRFIAFMLVVMICAMSVGCGAKGDELKNKNIEVKNEEKRIIAGSVAVAEMLLALDIPMVARPSTQYGINDELKDLPEIGLPMNPDLEVVKSLRGDVFITSGALKELIGSKFEQNGVNPMYADLSSYEAVKETIKKLGKEFGKEENAKKIIANFEKKEKEILKDIDPNKKVKVMILFGAPGCFMVATEKSFVGSLIDKVGAENITSQVEAKYKGPYLPFSLEVALKENPDVIFRMYHGYIEEAKKQVQEEFRINPQWQNFKAVKEKRVYDLDPEYFGVTGDMGATESLEKMKDYLYKK